MRQHASQRSPVQHIAFLGSSCNVRLAQRAAHPVAFHFAERSDAPVAAVRKTERTPLLRSRRGKRREFTLTL
jgi:hypothetical protein